MNRGLLARLIATAFPALFLGSYVDDPGGGGAPPSPPPPPPREPETFSREYVTELRNENKGWRLKASEAEKERDTHKTAAEKAAAEADEKIKGVQSTADQRVIRAELKALAIKAGMLDLDGLKLADLSTVKLNDKGDVEGAEALIDSLKKAKPYLFGTPGNSSTPGAPPSNTPPGAKLAKDMTAEEFAAEKRKLTRGR